jgi:hypothetical protein
MSLEASARTWTRTAKYLGLPLFGFGLVVADARFPFVRFSNELANVIVGALSWLLPFVTAIRLVTIPTLVPRRSLITGVGFVLLLPLLLFCPFGLLISVFEIWDTYGTGVNLAFEAVASVPMDGYSVGIYRTDYCGAPCSFTIYILQEKPILPGILLVRELYEFDPAGEATYKVIAKDVLRVDVPAYGGDAPARSKVFRLKPYLYF